MDIKSKDLISLSNGAIKQGPYLFVLSDKSFLVIHNIDHIDLEKESQVVDIIIFGNTHKPQIEKKNRALLINPGEGCGTRTGKSTVATLDLESMRVKIHELEDVYQ